MLIALTTLAIIGALALTRRAGNDAQLIVHRPYNNRYSDAAGAREDNLN